MPERRKNFTTLAVEKRVAEVLKRQKKNPFQSDSDILAEILGLKDDRKFRR